MNKGCDSVTDVILMDRSDSAWLTERFCVLH